MPTSPRRARRRGTPLASLCEAAQCSYWVVRRSVAEVSRPSAMTEGLSLSGGAELLPLRTVYRPCTLSLTCHSEGAKRPWESVPLFISTAALAATYLCRSAAKARFDNRPPPKGVSKEGGPQPSLFGRSRMGDFQGGRKIETSFPLEWRSLDTFFRQGKKVSRRRHPAPGRGTPLASLCEGGQAVEKVCHCHASPQTGVAIRSQIAQFLRFSANLQLKDYGFPRRFAPRSKYPWGAPRNDRIGLSTSWKAARRRPSCPLPIYYSSVSISP